MYAHHCPFCGSRQIDTRFERHSYYTLYWQQCEKCDCRGPRSLDKDDSIAWWNERDGKDLGDDEEPEYDPT